MCLPPNLQKCSFSCSIFYNVLNKLSKRTPIIKLTNRSPKEIQSTSHRIVLPGVTNLYTAISEPFDHFVLSNSSMNNNSQWYSFSEIIQDFHTRNQQFIARILVSLDSLFNKVSNDDKILKINHWPV